MRFYYSLLLCLSIIMVFHVSMYGQADRSFPAIRGSWEVVSSEDRTGEAPLFGSTNFTGQYLHILDDDKLVWQNEQGYFVANYEQSNGHLEYDDFQLKIEYLGEDVLRFFYDEPQSRRRVVLILENSSSLSSETIVFINANLEKGALTDDQSNTSATYWVPNESVPAIRNYKPYLHFPLKGVATPAPEIYKVVEELPYFPGCEEEEENRRRTCAQQELLKFIYKNIHYPEEARNKRVEGTAIVTFVVEPDGSVSGARVVRDLGSGTREEAMRLIKLMNDDGIRWIPGKQHGRAVRTQFNLPIKFKLQ